MGFFDRLIGDILKAPVKAALLPFRVLCVAAGGQHVMSAWERKGDRLVRHCSVCFAEEERGG